MILIAIAVVRITTLCFTASSSYPKGLSLTSFSVAYYAQTVYNDVTYSDALSRDTIAGMIDILTDAFGSVRHLSLKSQGGSHHYGWLRDY